MSTNIDDGFKTPVESASTDLEYVLGVARRAEYHHVHANSFDSGVDYHLRESARAELELETLMADFLKKWCKNSE